MAADNDSVQPVLREHGHTHADKYGQMFVEKAQKLHDKAEHTNGTDENSEKKKGPAGGFDSTPVPKAPPGYTLKITFHSAKNLPFADISLTSDPYIVAVLKTDQQKRHKQDPDVIIRTPTVHRNVNPVWNTSWTVAHVPASGFHLKARIYDEDPADHDDRLGNVHVNVNHIDDKWTGFKEAEFTIKKRMGSKRAYTLRGCAALISRNISMSGTVTISIENLGRSEGNGGRSYTVGPLLWKQHYSPLIGRITGVMDGEDKKTSKYNFQAIQMQLQGPVPESMYHRYVEFRPFIAGMFTSHTIRGRILNHALHHQHARIYNYDTSTKYGTYEEPCSEMTRKFLEFVHYDQGGRIFTYVLTLDGQLRFTETGKQFGIDMLSKHTMHSDVSIYIAFSGEFFIRRLKHHHRNQSDGAGSVTELLPPRGESPEEKPDQMDQLGVSQASSSTAQEETPNRPVAQRTESHSSNLSANKSKTGGKPSSFRFFRRESRPPSATNGISSPKPEDYEAQETSKDPSLYELIIDNDSGTYRPNAKYLPDLKKFLTANFPGLKIATIDCVEDEERMQRLKKEQAERRKNSGKQITYMQNSSMSSLSSSDEEELERRAGGGSKQHGPKATVQKEWQKIKSLGKGGDSAEKEENSTKEAARNAVIKEEDHDEKHGAAEHATVQSNKYSEKKTLETSNHEAHQQNHHVIANANANANDDTTTTAAEAKKESISTDTDHRSFDTAFTGGQHDHFVTPKASLGDGGLNQFGEDLETPKAKEGGRPVTGGSTVHNTVTVEGNGWGI